MTSFFLNHLAWFVPLPILIIGAVLLVIVPGAWMAVGAFLRSTFGRILAVFAVTAWLAGLIGWESRAYIDHVDDLKIAKAKSELAIKALRDQIRANKDVETAATLRAEDAEKQSQDLQGKLDAYVKDLASRKPEARCTLSDHDVRSLRAIAGRGRKAVPTKPAH